MVRPPTFNPYAYVQGDPINLADPTGQFSMGGLVGGIRIALSLYATLSSIGAIREAGLAFITNNSIQNQSRSHGTDVATVVTHGVAGSPYGWSREPGWASMPGAFNGLPSGLSYFDFLQNAPNSLNNDLYEHTWGGFDLTGLGVVPSFLQHALATFSLAASTNFVFAKGYSEVNIMSHSWGTAISHQAMTSGLSAPINDWITFGSPLKASTPRPIGLTGHWGDLYSNYDAVTWLEMFPPFRNVPDPANTFAGGSAIRASATWWRNLSGNLSVPAGTPINTWYLYNQPFTWVAEHGAYWLDSDFLTPVISELS